MDGREDDLLALALGQMLLEIVTRMERAGSSPTAMTADKDKAREQPFPGFLSILPGRIPPAGS